MLCSDLVVKVKRGGVSILARVRIRSEEEVAALEAEERRVAAAREQQLQFQHQEAGGYGADEEAADVQAAQLGFSPITRDGPKVGRNDPCPCGSGKKFKHCHGQLS